MIKFKYATRRDREFPIIPITLWVEKDYDPYCFLQYQVSSIMIYEDVTSGHPAMIG